MPSTDDPQGTGVPQAGAISVSAPPATALEKIRARLGGHKVPPAPPPPGGGGDDDDEDGMLRMSFLDHLQELRSRIIKILIGVAVAFGLSLTFSGPLWNVVCQPAVEALQTLKVVPPELASLEPMEGITIIWFKLPVLCAIFLSSPWILYQIWAFIAPGLYRRERKWAAPFILTSAGLFVTGGLFAYFVVFRFALTFLLGIGMDAHVRPVVSISRYFDLFVNVILGVSLVFEMPVLIFFLTLLRIISPSFLLRNSRYAILVIFIIAAVVTPTPDVFNLMLFALPMCVLFFVGLAASYILVLHREHRHFPWWLILLGVVAILSLAGLGAYMAVSRYGYHLISHWPFLMK
jgi:sec-independent protein translocase protein TatC